MKKNIAITGCGHWGKNLVRNLYELNSLYAICDVDKNKLKLFKMGRDRAMERRDAARSLVCAQLVLRAFSLLALIVLVSALCGCQGKNRWAAPRPKLDSLIG